MASSGGEHAAATPYQYAGQSTADQGALSGVNQLQGTNYAAGNQGAVQGIASGIGNGTSYDASGVTSGSSQLINAAPSLIPYATQQAQQAQQFSPSIASSLGTGQQLTQQSGMTVPYAQQALQTGFDPQNALYKQQFQQNTDNTRAAEAAQGTASTPYGAGVEAQSDQNFDLNWQNQQLARQQQAAGTVNTLLGTQDNTLGAANAAYGTAGSLAGAADNSYGSASSLLSGAGSALGQGAALGQSVGTNALQAYQTADQTGAMANQNTQSVIADFLSYLQGGTSANQAATQATSVSNSAAAGNAAARNNIFSQIGSGVGDLFGLF